jgi:hypothetical protein
VDSKVIFLPFFLPPPPEAPVAEAAKLKAASI